MVSSPTLGKFPRSCVWGFLATLLLALGSFGGGAIRYRGGVLDSLGLEFLSYGHGAAFSNTAVWLSILLLCIAWVMLGRDEIFSPSPAPLARLKKTLWVWILPLLAAAPVLSRDVYSYLMQGAMLRDGFDPYREGASVNPGPFLLEVSHDWRNTTTPYGPLHLGIGDLITRLVGDNVTLGVLCYKILSIIGFAGIAWAIPRIAQELGANPQIALWLGVMNPLMILHMIAGMHNESLMVGLVSIGILLTLRRHFFSGVALVAIAVSLKATAAIALPFMVWMAVWFSTTRTSSRVARFFSCGLTGAIETFLILIAVTRISGSNWGWVAELSGNSKVINPLALPSLLAGAIAPLGKLFDEDFAYNAPLGILRTLGSILMLLGLVAAWWLFRGKENNWRIPTISGIVVAYTVAFTLNSVTLPWYYASIISLIGCIAFQRQWILPLVMWLSLVLAFAFTGSGNHQLYNLVWMICAMAGAWVLSNYGLRKPLPVPAALLRGQGDHAAHQSVDPAKSHLH